MCGNIFFRTCEGILSRGVRTFKSHLNEPILVALHRFQNRHVGAEYPRDFG